MRNKKGQFIKGQNLGNIDGFKKGKSSWITGKKHKLESIQKMKQSHKGQKAWNKGTSKIKERKCKFCLKLFIPSNYEDEVKFCSHKCYSIFNRGEKNNMWKGGPITKSCLFCKKIFKQYPSDKSKTCSFYCAGKIQSKTRIGIKSANYKGGITSLNHLIRNSEKMKEWAKKGKERDDFRCFSCGARSGEVGKTLILHSDHIFQFSKYPHLRSDLLNHQTLCKNCHIQKTIFERTGKMTNLINI